MNDALYTFGRCAARTACLRCAQKKVSNNSYRPRLVDLADNLEINVREKCGSVCILQYGARSLSKIFSLKYSVRGQKRNIFSRARQIYDVN